MMAPKVPLPDSLEGCAILAGVTEFKCSCRVGEKEREREMCICKEERCMRQVAKSIILMSLPVPLSENMKPGREYHSAV